MKSGVHIFLILLFLSPLFSLGQQSRTGNKGNMPDCIPLPVPTITGPQSACSGTGGYIYTTEPGMIDYTWGISPGGAILSGAGTNSVVVSWDVAGSRWINLNYTNSSGCQALIPTNLDVTVDSSMVAGITISASVNPVCSGTPVTFSATPINGGTSPAFQWKRNGINVGSNNITYTYTPSNGDQITCEMTSGLTCSNGSPVLSAPVVITVTQIAPAGISITASSNPVCYGTSVTYQATPYNGGASPSYQWRVNGINEGTNSPVFASTPENGDIISCIMTSGSSCVSGSPALSNSVTMTVSQNQLVSVSISPSANPSCQGSPVTFTAVPTTGGTLPAYQWLVNGVASGSNSPVFTYLPLNNDVITCRLTSNASCTTGNPALSNAVIMSISQSNPVSVTISPSSNPVCQGNSVTFTATPLNPGFNPTYLWSVNGFNVGSNSTTYSYVPANGDVVGCKLTSGDNCASGNPASSNLITMNVSPVVPVSLSIAASTNPVCVGMDVTFTAYPFNGGSSPVFHWKLNGSNVGTNTPSFTYTPVTGDVVSCQMVSSAPCTSNNTITSNAITMAVSSNLPVSVSISASSTQVCQGMTPVFIATPVNGGPSPSYQWKVNGISNGTNSAIFSYSPADGDIVSCQLTSSIVCATGNPAISNTIPMTVTQGQALPVSVNVTASANPSCQGQSVTFTATPVNGGTTPVYQWAVNGLNVGTNSPTFSYVPTHGDFVTCQLTSSYSCAIGNPANSGQISMVVNPNQNVSIGITSSANPACLGTPVTFTATPVNAGSSPVYQWKVNNINVGSNLTTFTYNPANNDVVTCQLTSSVSCAIANPVVSNSITMVIQSIQPVTVSIATLTNPSCKGSQVTFTATGTNGGTTPQYQWKLNGTTVGANSQLLIFIPLNGDVITCQYTSNAICVTGPRTATSNAINMTVSSELPAGVNITSSVNPFCEGSTVTFTATPINGGTIPVYQWKVNCASVGTNSPVYTYNPVDGDFVTCKMTSNLTCAIMNPATSNGINMAANGLNPVSVTIAASQTQICQGSSATFTASPVNGGSTPVYQWKVNGTNTGTNNPVFTYNPANGDVVTCRLTSNLACAKGSPAVSNSIVMSVSSALPTSVSISTRTNPFCQGSAVTFLAVPANGGIAPAYQWKVNGINSGTNSNGFTYSALNGDVVSCQLTSNASCVTGTNPVVSNPVTLSSNTSLPASVSISATATSVCQGTTVTCTATAVNGGNAPAYQWKVNNADAGTNSSSFSYSPANGDNIQCGMTSSLSCATGSPAVSNTIQETVTPQLPVSVSIAASQNPCCQGTAVTFTASGINGGPTPSYQWQVNCINVGPNSSTYTYTPQNGDVIVCRFTSNQACVTGNPAISPSISMVVLPVLPVSLLIAASVNPFCTGTTVTYTTTSVNEGPSPVYQWIVNGTPAGINTATFTYPPLGGDVVTCKLNSSFTCVSNNPATSNSIVMADSSSLVAAISISASANPICSGSFVVFTAIAKNPGATPVYYWKVNGVHVGPNNDTYQYFPADGDVVTCVLTSSLICGIGNPATSNAINMTVYPPAPVSISIMASANPSCQGATVNYTALPQNPGTTPVYQWKVNNVNQGISATTFSYTPVTGDVVNCRLTSNATCRTGNPATSNSISMLVSPSDPASISIAASSNPICQGSTVTFTSNTFNGGTAPFFQWKVNGINTGGNTPAFSYIPANGDIVVCQMTSNSSCITVNTATSNTVTMTVSPIQNVSVSITASTNPTCLGSVVLYTANAQSPGTSPVYQWKVNGVVSGTNSSTMTYIPSNGDAITCKLTSNATCSLNNPATSNTINMTVSQSLPVSIAVTPSSNPACLGEMIAFTATPVNGGTGPVYQWRVNGINVGSNILSYAYTPSNGDHVTCQLTSSFSCGTGNPALSAPVNMTINPYVPVSVSISASSNPVCNGTPVTYTASPVNGGPSPLFQWSVNGVVTGTNTAAFIYTPVNGDIITCKLTSSIECPINNIYSSNAITMNVLQPTPAAIQITPTVNPACQGIPITFMSTVINGGPAPSYQWKVNGSNSGSNLNSFSYIPSNGDVVSCQLTSSSSCVTSNTVNSNLVTMVVSSDLHVNLSISASANPACLGQSVTYTASPVNAGANPVYQWSVNGFTVGTNNPMYSYTPSDGDMVSCQLLSDLVCASGNPATAAPVSMVVNQSLPVSISIQASGNPVCTETLVTYTSTVTNSGFATSYQWKVNGVNAGTNSPTFSFVPVNGDVVSCSCTATELCGSSSNATSQQITMVVSTVLPVSISITATANPLCQVTPVTYSASIVNGGALPFYQWRVNSLNTGTNNSSYTYTPANGDQVQCLLISALTCADISPAPSNTIAMVVGQSLVAGVSVAATPSGTICQGTPVTVSATPVNGGTPGYQWFKNNLPVGTNQPFYTFTPSDGDLINVVMTSGIACVSGNPATSNTLSMSVVPQSPVSVSINADQNPVCTGTPVTLTATPVNGGTPVFHWYKNNSPVGSNAPAYTYIPVNGDQVYVTMNSSLSCVTASLVTSNVVTLNVTAPMQAGVSILADHNPVCSGSPVLLTAVPVNGGSAAYQWFVNNLQVGTSQNNYSFTPANGDEVHVVMTSGQSCVTGSPATSNSVVLSVTPYVPASVSISVDQNNICQGTSVTFTASPVNGGTTPVYQWYRNGLPAGTGQASFSCIPVTGDQVYVVMTSGLLCSSGSPATSNTIQMLVTERLPVSVSVLADQNPVCTGTSVLLTATPVNGGTPAYQWFKNSLPAGSNQPTYSYTPSNGDQVYVVMNSSLSCISGNPANSNTVLMVVNPPLPVSVSIVASQNPVCAGSTVTFTANPVNGGVPAYQWFRNNLPVGSNLPTYTFTPVNGDIVHVVMTSGLSCISGSPATSSPFTVIVTPVVTAGVSASVSQNNICQGTAVTFTAAPVNGGTPTYQWFKNGIQVGSNQPTYSFVPINGDQVYAVMTSSISCITGTPATSNIVTMTVNAPLPVSVFISASQNPVCPGTNVIFTATPVNGGTPAYQWYVNNAAVGTGGASYSFIPLDGDDVNLVMTSSLTCVSGSPATSNIITMGISPVPATPVATASGNELTSSAAQGNQWVFEGTIIPGATTQVYTAGEPGWYWTFVTLSGCMSDTSNHVRVFGVGIDDLPGFTNMIIYPVPNDGRFRIGFTVSSPVKADILVYNSLGKKIYEKTDETFTGKSEQIINLKPLADGVYSVVISESGKKMVRLFMVRNQ